MSKPKLDFKSKSMILSILTGLGVVATGVLAAHCAKKDDDTRSTKQRVLIYAPAIASGVITIGFVVANAKMSSEEVAALTIACTGLTAKFNDYRDATIEHLGSSDEIAEVDKIFARKQAERVLNDEVEQTKEELCTFVDSYTGLSFVANYDKTVEAERKIEERYRDDEPVPWCDLIFYANESTEPYESTVGPQVGWSKAAMEDIYGDCYGDQSDVTIPMLEITNVALGNNRYRIDYNFEPEFCYYEY